jgi:hypothetical protein
MNLAERARLYLVPGERIGRALERAAPLSNERRMNARTLYLIRT